MNESGQRVGDRAGQSAPGGGRSRRLAAGRLALAAAAAAAVSFAGAASIDSLDIDKHRGRYELVADAQLAASPESIYAVLTDYEDNAFQRISSVYKESDYLEPAPDGTPIVYTLMEGCLLRFCLRMKRVERLETREPHYIKSYTLPDRSNFKYSTSEWRLEPHEGGTKMTYRLEMEPDFFVPPVIGPWYLKRTLSSGGVRAVSRIERLARELDAANAAAALNEGEATAEAVTAPPAASGPAAANTTRPAPRGSTTASSATPTASSSRAALPPPGAAALR